MRICVIGLTGCLPTTGGNMIQVRAKFGAEADGIGHVEVYEISEYGEEPSRAFMDMLER